MGDPLPAAHELVFHGIPERIAHAAVIAREADAAAHRRAEVRGLLLLDLRHREDGHDEREVMNGGVGEGGRGRLHADVETLLLQPSAHDGRAEIGVVASPAAIDDHGFTHCRYS